jgi:transposase
MAMGWFTAKDAPSDKPVRGKTISDSDWHKLQARAAKANKQQAAMFSHEANKRREQGRDNYRKRHHN